MRCTVAVLVALIAASGPGTAAAAAGPSPRTGADVARLVAPARSFTAPAGTRPGPMVSARTAWSGQPSALLVLRETRRAGRSWLRVLLPDRPTPTSAWIPRDRVRLSHTRWWIDVHIGRRDVTVRRDGQRVRRWRAVVGAATTPTPHALAAVYERNRQADPTGFLGPWSLSLTALSPVLEDFGGGPGRIAIHGRGAESLTDPLGSARSHGCIRIDNRAIRFLAAHIPAGTPVRILR